MIDDWNHKFTIITLSYQRQELSYLTFSFATTTTTKKGTNRICNSWTRQFGIYVTYLLVRKTIFSPMLLVTSSIIFIFIFCWGNTLQTNLQTLFEFSFNYVRIILSALSLSLSPTNILEWCKSIEWITPTNQPLDCCCSSCFSCHHHDGHWHHHHHHHHHHLIYILLNCVYICICKHQRLASRCRRRRCLDLYFFSFLLIFIK